MTTSRTIPISGRFCQTQDVGLNKSKCSVRPFTGGAQYALTPCTHPPPPENTHAMRHAQGQRGAYSALFAAPFTRGMLKRAMQ